MVIYLKHSSFVVLFSMAVDAEATLHDVALCCPLTLKLDEFYSYPATLYYVVIRVWEGWACYILCG